VQEWARRRSYGFLIASLLAAAPAVAAAREPVYYTNSLSVDPARAAEFLVFIREAAKDTRSFKGCRYFAILVDDTDPSRVLFYEIWDSKEDHEAYRAWRARTGFSERIRPFLRGTESHYYAKVDD
jgi:quinol monooxygenase YgiN